MTTAQIVRHSKSLTLIGVAAALVGPFTSLIGSLAALMIAAVLVRRGERRAAALLVTLALLAVAVMLMFVTPVSTGERPIGG